MFGIVLKNFNNVCVPELFKTLGILKVEKKKFCAGQAM